MSDPDNQPLGFLATVSASGISFALQYIIVTLAIVAVMDLLGLVFLSWLLLATVVGLEVVVGALLGACAYLRQPAKSAS